MIKFASTRLCFVVCLWILWCWHNLHTTNAYLKPTVNISEPRRHTILTRLFQASRINTKDLIISRCIHCLFVHVCFLAKTCRIITITVAWFFLIFFARWVFPGTRCVLFYFYFFPLSLTGSVLSRTRLPSLQTKTMEPWAKQPKPQTVYTSRRFSISNFAFEHRTYLRQKCK